MMIVALPVTAVAGTLVRSPDSDLSGRPSILPSTVTSTWALVRPFVVWLDSWSTVPRRAAASPAAEPERGDEHPATSPEATVTAARAETLRDMRNLRWRDFMTAS